MLRGLLTEIPAARSLPVALAHSFATCKAGKDQERLAMLNRLYARLRPADKMRCQYELHECKEARRAAREAAIAC